MAPQTTPIATTSTQVNGMERFSTLVPIREASTASVKTEATERSIPPDISTMERPRTTRPNSETWRPRDR